MNENELRQALRATMATASVPPPMNETPVLDAAQRAQRRHRARWAGAGSAVAAAAVVGLAVVVVATTSGAGGADVGGTGGSAASSTHTGTTTREQPSGTESSWPNGQTDRTAHKGPEYDKGLAVRTELDASVPAGYESPEGLKGTGELAGAPMRVHQAQYLDTVDGTEVWEYMADIVVTKGGGYGRLLAEVTTPGGETTGDGCDLQPGLWGMTGTCTEIEIDGKRVGVFTAKRGEGDQFDQWAGYRHDDGTVVIIGQAHDRAFTNFAPLAGRPLTAKRLAELAADTRFRLD
jgi:hypothetical protein